MQIAALAVPRRHGNYKSHQLLFFGEGAQNVAPNAGQVDKQSQGVKLALHVPPDLLPDPNPLGQLRKRLTRPQRVIYAFPDLLTSVQIDSISSREHSRSFLPRLTHSCSSARNRRWNFWLAPRMPPSRRRVG